MVRRFLRWAAESLARLPGLPVLVAILLVVANFVVRLLPGGPVVDWLVGTDLLLHLGVVLGLLGILLGDAL
ncbi:MAG: hypothetical protein E3J64_08185 [Anaerolineales bacterium]|nr:MAG: hypothetical protein E3J64_08185 [Anaerolineales bacterium]